MWDSVKEALQSLTHPSFWWAIAGVVMLFMEMLIPGLVIFFFGVGALVVALICLFLPAMPLTWQLLLFLVFSLTSLFVLRRWLKRAFTGQQTLRGEVSDSEKEFVGERASCVADIVPGRRGSIEFHGSHWAAESDVKIAAGAVVEIVGRRSTVLQVREIEARSEEQQEQ